MILLVSLVIACYLVVVTQCQRIIILMLAQDYTPQMRLSRRETLCCLNLILVSIAKIWPDDQIKLPTSG